MSQIPNTKCYKILAMIFITKMVDSYFLLNVINSCYLVHKIIYEEVNRQQINHLMWT
jgi:hypothetical protein